MDGRVIIEYSDVAGFRSAGEFVRKVKTVVQLSEISWQFSFRLMLSQAEGSLFSFLRELLSDGFIKNFAHC